MALSSMRQSAQRACSRQVAAECSPMVAAPVRRVAAPVAALRSLAPSQQPASRQAKLAQVCAAAPAAPAPTKGKYSMPGQNVEQVSICFGRGAQAGATGRTRLQIVSGLRA